jgi:hypothetical protein
MNKAFEALSFTGDLIDSLVNGDGSEKSKNESKKFTKEAVGIVRGGVALVSGGGCIFFNP